jgi:hypothetical protein
LIRITVTYEQYLRTNTIQLTNYIQIAEKQLCIQINVTEYWRGKQNGNDNAIDNIWYNLNDDFVNVNATDATAEAGTAYPSKIHTGC